MSKVKQYRKKPVIIEALEWDGNNYVDILKWTGFKPEELLGTNTSPINRPDWKITIPTLEGLMTADICDYIIKGVKGEFYPCKPDIFEATYEEVNGQN